MVIADESIPTDIVDRLLWQEAQHMLSRHSGPDLDGTCLWCGSQWPCAPRRLAERADAASRRPWREAWTLRHDLNSIRAMPAMRAGFGGRADPDRLDPPPGPRREVNRGYFD